MNLYYDNKKKSNPSKPTYLPLLYLKEFKIDAIVIVTYRYIHFPQIPEGNPIPKMEAFIDCITPYAKIQEK